MIWIGVAAAAVLVALCGVTLTLPAAPLGLVAFRGCPTCWVIGLVQTVSRGRLERRCADGVCTLAAADSKQPVSPGPRPGGGRGPARCRPRLPGP